MWAYHQYCQYCQYRHYDYNNYYNYRPRYTSPFFRMPPLKYALYTIAVEVLFEVIDNGANDTRKDAQGCNFRGAPVRIVLSTFKPCRQRRLSIEKERNKENHSAEELAKEVLEGERAEKFVHPH